MGQFLSNWAVTDFGERVHHEYQAKERLRDTSMHRMGTFEQTKFPVMGQGTATKRTGTQIKLELMSVPHSRVTCSLEKYNASDMVDIWDQAEVPIDERNQLARVIAGGLGRRRDQIKIDAMIAAKTAGTITKSVAASGLGGENNLNIERINKINKLLGDDEVEDDVIHFAVHAANIEGALNTVEVGSKDFNSFQLLQNGGIKDRTIGWGMTWHKFGNRGVEGGLAVSANIRQGWAWATESLGTANTPLRSFDISWLGDYGSWITSGFMSLGACVIDGKGIVEVLMDES